MDRRADILVRMSLYTPDLHVEIAVANMDLYPINLAGGPSWSSGFEEHIPFLERTGCRNYEIHPTERLLREAAEHQERGDTEIVALVVGSLHQTFNEGAGLVGKLGDRAGLLRQHVSPLGMTALQTVVRRPLPTVLYPDRLWDTLLLDGPHAEPAYPSSYPIVQPCAEVYRDLGEAYADSRLDVRNNGTLIGLLADHGYIGLCPDTVHARRTAEDGSPVPTIGDVWADQFTSGRTYQMHVSADRQDMKGRDPDLAEISIKEFQAFTARKPQAAARTEMGGMITTAVERWVEPQDLAKSRSFGKPVLRMVLEIPPLPAAVGRRTAQHARFVSNLAELVREAGATPLLYGDQLPATRDS